MKNTVKLCSFPSRRKQDPKKKLKSLNSKKKAKSEKFKLNEKKKGQIEFECQKKSNGATTDGG